MTNNEVRERLATAPDSPYSGIDLSGEIEIDDTEENPPQDPNADPETDFTQRGIEARYRRQLDNAVSEMHNSVLYWLRAEYRKTDLAQDASPLT